MYEIAVEQHFDAAHFLRNYHGKCEALHGHRYRLIARVRAVKLDESGLGLDFTELKRLLAESTKKLDHILLNDIKPFDNINPSAENIARSVFEELKPKIKTGVNLYAVEVWESPESQAIYTPD